MERTQVGIIGAGPAGLMLAQLLGNAGIENRVLESRSREYVEERVRAGVLEHGAVELLRAAGVGDRLDREGLSHDGINLQFAGERHRIDFRELCGRGIVVYGQQEIVKDLIAARLAASSAPLFEAEATDIDLANGDRPVIRYLLAGRAAAIECDFVAACDGSHGIGRAAAASPATRVFQRDYPYAWLGILARVPPADPELIYSYHPHGFALHSMRSPEVSRLYLQVEPGTQLGDWPADRLWDELRLRLAEPGLGNGEIIESGVTPMRSLVIEPLRSGRLFLCGDAAHIVPPTGAKGMNLALGDVALLAQALSSWYRNGHEAGLNGYSEDCSRRVWRAQEFSSFMTRCLHANPSDDDFERRLRVEGLRRLTQSRAAATALAENYTGAAIDGI